MTITAHHYRKIKELEAMASNNGFAVVLDSHNWNINLHDQLGLVPADDALPIYSRTAVIYQGTVEDLITFLAGWNKSRLYLDMLGACNEKCIQRKEQDYRNIRLAKMIKDSKDEYLQIAF